MLVSLAITACTTLIPTRANAFAFKFTPAGETPAFENQQITFTVSFDPQGLTVEFLGLDAKMTEEGFYQGFEWDGGELSHLNTAYNTGFIFSNTTDIAKITFTTLKTLKKDGDPDFFNVTGLFDVKEADDVNGGKKGKGTPYSSKKSEKAEGFEVVDIVPIPVAEPVPEPLTMLGAATALGYGIILKRKSSKMKKS
jgi:hypothetical protein